MSTEPSTAKAAIRTHLAELKNQLQAEADVFLPIITVNKGRGGAAFCYLLFAAIDVLAIIVHGVSKDPQVKDQPERLRRLFNDKRFTPQHFASKSEIMTHLFSGAVINAFTPATGPVVRMSGEQVGFAGTFTIRGHAIINPAKFLEDVLGMIAKVSAYVDTAPETEIGPIHARLIFKEGKDRDQLIKLVTGAAFEEMPTMGG
ncbi:hypothetical protein LBMAG53_04410 [Planctomycetota bacterium]|nr:hypothetical protein LBMAG53_04410 [Planctomycetota bacterium]